MLTDTKVKNFKPNDKPYRKLDGNGLYLLVEPNGRKKWQFRFSWMVGSKKKRPWQSLGPYPQVSLREARKLSLESQQLVNDGINPIEQARAQKQQEIEQRLESESKESKRLFVDVYKEYCDFKTKSRGDSPPEWKYYTLKKHNERFYNHVIPFIGDCEFDQIKEPDLREILINIESRGTLSIRDKVRTVFNGLFSWAHGHDYIDTNVSLLIPKAIFAKRKTKNFRHVTTKADLGIVVNKIDNMQCSYEIKAACKFLVYIFVRPGNVSSLRWDQVDLENNLVEFSDEDMKSDKRFLVPLSLQAKKILENIYEITGYSDYVFFSPYSSLNQPIARDSILNTMKKNGIENTTSHGFRHAASTILHEMGVHSDALEVQLSHVIPGVKGVYNKAEYFEERVKMMQDWADLVDSLKE